MPRYSVPLEVEIEAEHEHAAFAYVRTYYTVTDNFAVDQGGKRDDVEFYVGEATELKDDEFVIQ